MNNEFLNETVAALKEAGFESRVLPDNSIEVTFDKENGAYGQIHTEELFNVYEEDPSIVNDIVEKVKDSAAQMTPDVTRRTAEEFKNATKEGFLNSLIVRAVNANSRKTALKDAIYRRIDDDILLVLYQRINNGDPSSFTSHAVTHDDVKRLEVDMTDEELLNFALSKTADEYPAYVLTTDNALVGGPEIELSQCKEKAAKLLLSCKNDNPNGATTVFYPNTTRQLSNVMNGEFVVVFMNTMDAMVMKPDEPKLHGYCKMASEDNEFGEFLSPKAYYFDENGSFMKAE